MSTTEAGRFPAAGEPGSSNRDAVSLQTVMESARRLDELSCARIVGNVAEAVHAAQRSGQPIAALTPSAIVLQPDGGIVFAAAPASPRYLAPETLRGSSGDRRSHVFALGVMLWEVLAHERLFAGGDDEAIRRSVLETTVRSPSEFNANVPAELDAICKRALARDPVERYQSARVMAADIDAVLDDAGYPESNEAIAKFIAAMAAPPHKPMATVAPHGVQLQATISLPAIRPPAAIRLPTAPPVAPAAIARPPTAPPVAPAAIARPPKQPPRAETQPPIVPRPATQPPVFQPPAEPPSAARPSTVRTTPLPSIASGSARDTLPPPSASRPVPVPRGGPGGPFGDGPGGSAPRQGASWAITGSGKPAAPSQPAAPNAPLASLGSAVRPAGSAIRPTGPARTEILGPGSAPAEQPRLATTTSLGSNAIAGATLARPSASPDAAGPSAAAGAAPTPDPVPFAVADAVAPPSPMSPVAAVPTVLGSFAPDLGEAPSFAPPAMPDPRPSAVAAPPDADDLDGWQEPTGSRDPASAKAAFLATPLLGMPPGMTVAPTSPPVPLRTADSGLDDDDGDGDFGRERHIDPAAVVALRRAERTTGGHDVLAGWGWSPDSVQAVTDEDEFSDATRASRKRLVIAIGSTLGAVVVIAIAAFAFGGAKQPDPNAQIAANPVAVTPVADKPTKTEPPSTEPAAAITPPANLAVEPPTPEHQPPASAAQPSHAGSAPAASAAEPPPPLTKIAAAPPSPPAKTTAAPAKSPPGAAALSDLAKQPETKQPETKKPETKKPAPRPPSDKALRRPMPPERIARATPKVQPIDPYAVSDIPKTDPAAVYKTGLQQYARGDTTGALATFRASLSSNPSFAPTWRGLGLVYEKLGNTAQARSSFQRYLKLAPSAPDADQVRDRLEHLGSGS